MTVALRAALILASLVTLVFITRRVRASRVRLEDSVFWFCFAALLLVVSISPGIFVALSDLVGTYAPSNFVFLFFIFVLLIQSFNLHMRISQADTKIKEISQQLAIEKLERHMHGQNLADASQGDRGEGAQRDLSEGLDEGLD